MERQAKGLSAPLNFGLVLLDAIVPDTRVVSVAHADMMQAASTS